MDLLEEIQESGGNVDVAATAQSEQFEIVDESPVEVFPAVAGVGAAAGSSEPAASAPAAVTPAEVAPAESAGSVAAAVSVAPAVASGLEATSDAPAAPVAADTGESEASAPTETEATAAPADSVTAESAGETEAPKPVLPKPGGFKPAAPRPGSGQSATYNPALVAAAEAFGEITPDGGIFVQDDTAEGGKRQVGTVQSATATPSESMSIYVQRYLVLEGKTKAFEARLTDPELAPRDAEKQIARFEKDLAEPAIIGDLATLRTLVGGFKERAAAHKAEMGALQAAAKAEALKERTALVEKAEALIAGDHSKIQWKTTGEEMRNLMEEWKTAQKSPVRINRNVEADLWKRFRAARSTFDQARRQYFNDLDEANAAVKAKKEAIVREAEKLSSSTEWGPTSAAYRDLLTKWKAAGRAGRKDDDNLWALFRAAQDKFFAARDESNKASDAELDANLVAKKAILDDAEKILPVTDLSAAKAALRGIQDRWEAVGNVPRAALGSVEGRMKAVEQAVRDAEQAQWKRTNPETKARAEGAAAQLQKAISGLEADLAKAKAAGNTRKVTEIEGAIAARKSWLEQVEKAASDHS
ncbi:MAG: DUF349 domain-containing protein [Cellulomonadaceae bacterium]|jgi:hypothetical protein|nr:DUF349 domain-containing protein [Cellulomonadaceae bacterium]